MASEQFCSLLIPLNCQLAGECPWLCNIAFTLIDRESKKLSSGSLVKSLFSPVNFRLARKIGIGAAVTRRPLPHHGAYGSAQIATSEQTRDRSLEPADPVVI